MTEQALGSHKRQLKIGLIGAGRIGRLHAQTLVQRVPAVRLSAVYDINQQAALSIAAELGIPQVQTDVEALFADNTLDAVLICSSTDTHAPLIVRAAEAGKHIFCEKPIAASLPQIDDALAAAGRAGVKLMVGFNRRFDPNHARIKRAIDNGDIGTPHLLHIVSRDPAPPPLAYIRSSGGLFFDMTIHDFDMARFLFGDVMSIYAAATTLVDPAIAAAGDVDTAVLTLHFANGAIGTIENSRQAVYGYDQRVEVFGSAGSAVSANIYPNAVTFSNDQHIYRDLPLNFFIERYVPSYQAELQAFVDCVLNDTPPPVSGYDGRVPVVMAQAAQLSLQRGTAVALADVV